MVDEACRTSFDKVAELYDSARPGYPDQLNDDICDFAQLPESARLLEIGAGTGIATTSFAERRFTIIALEPGPALASFASNKLARFPNVQVVCEKFESWDAAQGSFDLVFAAQSFHWIDPEFGYQRIRHLLKAGGTMALFWNTTEVSDWEPTVRAQLDVVYDLFFPENDEEARPERHPSPNEEKIQRRLQEIDESGFFQPVHLKRYRWEKTYSTDEYIRLLGTYSPNLVLTEEVRWRFFDSVRTVLDLNGSCITIPYQTTLYLAAVQD